MITQDQYGFLWLGTTDGLNRFDGRNFIVYRNIPGDTNSLVNNIINAITVDAAGRVWVATNGGLCYYDFSKNGFTSIPFNDTIEQIDRHRVHAVCAANDGGVWFATKTHVHKWHSVQDIKSYTISASDHFSIKFIYQDSESVLWIGTSLNLIAYDEKRQLFFAKEITSAFSLEKNLQVTIHPVVPVGDQSFFTGTWYAGLQKVRLTADSIQSIGYVDQEGSDIRKHIVSGMAKNPDGNWWIGTYGTGLSVFDAEKGIFIQHLHHDPADAKSLSDDYVNDVFTDASGIVWVGTDSGLDKYDPLTQQFRSVSVPVAQDEFSVYRTPYTIEEDVNDPQWLWICIGGAGLYHYNSVTQEFIRYRHEENNPLSLPDNTVYTIYQDKQKRVWVGTRVGLHLFDVQHGNFYPAPEGLRTIPGGVHVILEGKNDAMWFATYSNGVYAFDEIAGKLSSYRYDVSDPNSLPDNRVFCMTEDHLGRIWIGTQNKGLCMLDPVTEQFKYFEHRKDDPSSIPDNGLYDMYEDDLHHMWIATENGLAEMNLADFSVHNFSTRDGLCNNDIFSITSDHQHQLWLATNNGVCRLDPVNHVFKNYFTHDGLPSNSMSGAVCCASDGYLYFSTSGMITYCMPDRMKINRRVPPVVITNFKIFDRQVPLKRNGGTLFPIHLSYKENMITFDFAALNFTNSRLNQYAYKLEGFNEDWIECGNRQSATFTNLDGGEYTFSVKACNNDGIWNEAGTEVKLIIDPPYWKTWWFYLVCFLVVSIVMYGIYRFRINQFLKLQQIRTRISRDLHDDIGSTLSSINMMSSMADQQAGSEKKSSELFQTISTASGQAMELMNDIVWSINPGNDKMEMILIRMRQYASEILEAAQIAFTLEMDEACNHISLPIERRKDFYLIYKEAINNMAKYSRASKGEIHLKCQHRSLVLVIDDDGCGFESSHVGSGNGLKNMKARAELLNGKILIQSSPGHGTHIELTIPIAP